MINRYRIATGSIYEWDSEQNAYIHIGKTVGKSKPELMKIRNAKCNKLTHVIYRDEDE